MNKGPGKIARAFVVGGGLEHFPCGCDVGLPPPWAFSAMKTPLHDPRDTQLQGKCSKKESSSQIAY
jgi:hypothetical protein